MDSAVAQILGVLDRPLTDQSEYFQRLAGSPDRYLRAAGFAALLDFGTLPRELWEDAVAESHHGVVATRAFRFFTANLEYELAERVAGSFKPADRSLAAEAMQAALALDAPRRVKISARQFLEDGRVDHLIAAAEQAEVAGGWAEALPWVTRALAVQPTVPVRAWGVLRMLETANQFEAIDEILAALAKSGIAPEVRSVFAAAVLLHKKDAESALHADSGAHPHDDAGRADGRRQRAERRGEGGGVRAGAAALL